MPGSQAARRVRQKFLRLCLSCASQRDEAYQQGAYDTVDEVMEEDCQARASEQRERLDEGSCKLSSLQAKAPLSCYIIRRQGHAVFDAKDDRPLSYFTHILDEMVCLAANPAC